MERVETVHRGIAALSLRTDALEWVVTTGAGPRVFAFRSRRPGAPSLFYELPEDAPRLHGYAIRGGHRLWRAPEDLVRTYQPDDEPLAVHELANGISLVQPAEPRTRIQKSIAIEAIGDRTVRVTHTLANDGATEQEVSCWALTMLRPGGYAVVPLPAKGNFAAGDLLPSYALVPWSYTDLSRPVWDVHRDYVGVRVALAEGPQKLGITMYPGWSAYHLEGSVFVKHAAVVAEAPYPDLGCAFETFTNGEMIELETLSPLVRLAPKTAARHVEHWTLFEDQPEPSSDDVFRDVLRPEVMRWLAWLSGDDERVTMP